MFGNVKIIEVKKKAGNRIVAFTNGREIILTLEVVARYSLKKGSELSPQQLDKLRSESDLQRADNYASYLLARREYSTGMLKRKLAAKGFDIPLAGKVIKKLKNTGLIDDARFARQTVESLLRNRPAGRAYLVACLRSKHISSVLAISVVDELLEDIDENELAVRTLRSRWRQYRKFDLETARRKAYNYLSRRAIGYRAAKFAFEKLTEEEQED